MFTQQFIFFFIIGSRFNQKTFADGKGICILHLLILPRFKTSRTDYDRRKNPKHIFQFIKNKNWWWLVKNETYLTSISKIKILFLLTGLLGLNDSLHRYLKHSAYIYWSLQIYRFGNDAIHLHVGPCLSSCRHRNRTQLFI